MALNKTQSVIIKELAKSPLSKVFYWTGGTLLAEKYLQHRHSYDVDLFSDRPFRYEDVSPLIQTVKKTGGLDRIEEKKVFDRWEFFLHNHSEVRCEFVHYDFKPLKARKKWQGVLVDSLDDLIANKTMAAIDRNEPKDVVDIYFLIIKKKLKCEKLIKLANKKFGAKLTTSMLLSRLVSNCRLLVNIKPLLMGSMVEQDKLISSIQRYFKRLSADFVRNQF